MTPEFKNMEDLLAQLLVPDTDSIERVSFKYLILAVSQY